MWTCKAFFKRQYVGPRDPLSVARKLGSRAGSYVWLFLLALSGLATSNVAQGGSLSAGKLQRFPSQPFPAPTRYFYTF